MRNAEFLEGYAGREAQYCENILHQPFVT